MTDGATPAPRPRAAFLDVLLAAAFVVAVTPFSPVQFGATDDAHLDEGYIFSYAVGFARSLRFGEDLVFTFGPYSFLFSGRYLPDTFAALLALTGAFAAVVAAGTVANARAARLATPLRAAWLLAAFVLLTNPDALFAAPALLLAASAFLPWNATPRTTVALAAAAGLAALVKTTMLCFAAPALVVVCLRQGAGLRERIAVVGAFAAAFVAAWLGAGQPLGGLPRYVATALEIVRGYEAMSLDAPPSVALRFGAAAALVGLAALAARAPSSGRRGLVAVAATAVVAFALHKHGTVRSDPVHWTAAASGLALFLLLLFAAAEGRRPVVRCVLVVAFAALVPGFGLLGLARDVPERVAAGAGGVADLVTGGADVDEGYAAAVARARAEVPDTFVPGTADFVPWGQASLVGRSEKLRARPVPLSYSAYTPSLTALNAAFLEGPGAPDHVFVHCSPVDGHAPLLEDPAVWPALLARYRTAPVAPFGRYVRLDRRAVPLARSLEVVSEHLLGSGAWLDLPADGHVVVEAAVEPTARSRVRSLVVANAMVRLDVRAPDGEVIDYRLPEHVGAAGFLASPFIRGRDDLARLYAADGDASAIPRAAAISFHLYGSSRTTIRVRLLRLTVGGR